MKKWVLLIVLLAALFGGVYFGSAYLAVSRFKAAAISADADRLEEAVDFPLVRANLKSQLFAAMMRRFRGDPNLRSNPIAGLGMLLGPSVVNRAVDAFVTPDGIAAVIRGERPDDGVSHDDIPKVWYSDEWLGADWFSVHIINASTQAEGPTLLFQRRGLFTWKLVKIGLPTDFLKPAPNASGA